VGGGADVAGGGPVFLAAAGRHAYLAEVVTRVLPRYIELRRDRVASSWFLVCRACGIKEHHANFWPASRAAHDHADFHEAEEDPPVTSAEAPS
jgi:hypothetical protein